MLFGVGLEQFVVQAEIVMHRTGIIESDRGSMEFSLLSDFVANFCWIKFHFLINFVKSVLLGN